MVGKHEVFVCTCCCYASGISCMRLVALAPGDRVSLATTALCRNERIALA